MLKILHTVWSDVEANVTEQLCYYCSCSTVIVQQRACSQCVFILLVTLVIYCIRPAVLCNLP